MSRSSAAGVHAATAACATALALAACSFSGAVPSSPPSPAQIEDALASRAAGLSSLRAQVRAELHGRDGTTRSAQMILVEAPDRIRIDVMSPFGPTHTMASNGSTLALHYRAEALVYRGAASAGNIARFTGVPLDIGVLASLVSALPPDLRARRPGRVRAQRRSWAWTRDLPGGGQYTLVIDRSSLLLRGLSVKGDRRMADLLVSFDDYRDAEGLRFPHRMEATVKGHGGVKLVYERVWRGVASGDNAFEIRAGPGARVLDMEEMDAADGLP